MKGKKGKGKVNKEESGTGTEFESGQCENKDNKGKAKSTNEREGKQEEFKKKNLLQGERGKDVEKRRSR